MSRNRSADRRAEVAAAAWRELFDFFVRTRAQRDRALGQLGLTPNDARALATLEPAEGVRMSDLAAAWGTDPSNATWAVSRLEQRGLVEREPLKSDRRVKMARLTKRGRDVRERLQGALYEPPPELEELDLADLETLRAILERTRQRRA
jgi:DNA-binding MarR family transcriptional regulator